MPNSWSSLGIKTYLMQVISILYQSAFDGTSEEFKRAGKQWKVDAILFPVYVLQGSSCYLVGLVVLLRLLSVKHPMTFSTTHKKLSKVISVTIWIALSVIFAVMLILSFLYHKLNAIQEQAYVIVGIIAFHIYFSLPILSTIVMYGALLYTVGQKKGTISTQLQETKKSTAYLTKWVVICLLVCNIPWMLWVFYVGLKYPSGGAANVFDTTFGV